MNSHFTELTSSFLMKSMFSFVEVIPGYDRDMSPLFDAYHFYCRRSSLQQKPKAIGKNVVNSWTVIVFDSISWFMLVRHRNRQTNLASNCCSTADPRRTWHAYCRQAVLWEGCQSVLSEREFLFLRYHDQEGTDDQI
jgi:hypothetical protein